MDNPQHSLDDALVERKRAADIVRQMRSRLAYYDYLLPGDYVPEVPTRFRWFRWRPAFTVTSDLIEWAGGVARARSLMDLDYAAKMIEEPDTAALTNQGKAQG